jgi:DNA-binding MarR family transcriptional regulator
MSAVGNEGSRAGPDPPSAADIVRALRRQSRATQRFLIACGREGDLGLLDFLALVGTAEGDGATPVDIGRVLCVRSSTMTGIADRLERNGLVRRAPHPSDRRLVLLKATRRGERLVGRTLGPVLDGLSEIAGSVEHDERRALARFLTDVTSLLVEHTAPPSTPRRAARPASELNG